ncbi:family 16 glycosylhydrolase [Pseudoalteromonas carrageenovora]|uniref:CBM96 family carbohydrate-binding protein n=1 Tax=Pseudoalteromonas carrageenovora TaxID=227 RepID=UPI00311D6D4D
MKLTSLIKWLIQAKYLAFYILYFGTQVSLASTVLFDDEPKNGTYLWSTSSSESSLTQADDPVADGSIAIAMKVHNWTQSGLRIAKIPPYKDTILEAKIFRETGSKGTLMFRRGKNSLKINLDESNSEFWTLDGQPGHSNYIDNKWHKIQIHLKHFDLNEGENILALGVQGPQGTGTFYMDSVSFIESTPDISTSPPVSGNWTVSFEENFDTNTLDPSHWHVGKQYLGMSGIAGNAGRENISVEAGMLLLEAEKSHLVQGSKSYKYKGAEVSTFRKFRQQYGYFEARIKHESTHGAWPAFWLLPDKGIYGNDSYRRQAFLKFNLGDVQNPVESAILSFKISKATSLSSIAIHKTLSTDWTQGSVTWNTKPNIDPVWFAQRYGQTTDSIIKVDVTDYIREQQIAGKEASFALVDNYMRKQLVEIYSTEADSFDDRPILIVNGHSILATDNVYVRGGEHASKNYGNEPSLLVKDVWGDTSSTFGKGMEFDIMEHLGTWGEGVSWSALHWDGYGSKHVSKDSGALYLKDLDDGFHVYGMHWEPNYVAMYVDNEKVWEFESERVGSLPSYIILSLQVGGWDGNSGDIDDDFFTNMFVDYVKVWTKPEYD